MTGYPHAHPWDHGKMAAGPLRYHRLQEASATTGALVVGRKAELEAIEQWFDADRPSLT